MEIGNAYDIPSPPFRCIHRVKKYKKLGNRESDVHEQSRSCLTLLTMPYTTYYTIRTAIKSQFFNNTVIESSIDTHVYNR